MSDASAGRAEIRSEIREFILAEFLPEEDSGSLTNSTPLISSGILDSISTAKLVAHLESRFGVRFKASEIGASRMDTIDLITSTVESKLEG